MPENKNGNQLPPEGTDHTNGQLLRVRTWLDQTTMLNSEWHRSRMRCSSGWANDPAWSQSKRARSTHIDPEDDQQTDPALPSGSTWKTWDPYADSSFWHKKSSGEDPAKGPLSVLSMQWRPKLCADRDMSSVAGDTSEGSTSAPRLECIDELDKDALKEVRERVTQALARKGSS